MNTPKTRGLRNHLIALKQYNNNDFLDGKKLELSHIIPKWIQKKWSNHKGLLKYWVCMKCFRMLSLLYAMNGGKWGPNWSYQIGRQALQLKHPRDASKPHSFLKKWIIPTPMEYRCRVEVTSRFDASKVASDYWTNLYTHVSFADFLTSIADYFQLPAVTLETVQTSDCWSMRKVKGFKFYNTFKSFAVSISDETARVLVRMKTQHIMEFKDIIEVKYNDEAVTLMHGKYWSINKSKTPDKFCNDFYASMDYVNINRYDVGWNFITNIEEPIFFIHDCVSFNQQIKRLLPQDCKPDNAYIWTQNMLYWSNRLHEYCTTHPNVHVELPCGPKYICIQHNQNACTDCTKSKGLYPSTEWNVEWCCNLQYCNKMYIFDSKSGLVMTGMKAVKRQID